MFLDFFVPLEERLEEIKIRDRRGFRSPSTPFPRAFLASRPFGGRPRGTHSPSGRKCDSLPFGESVGFHGLESHVALRSRCCVP